MRRIDKEESNETLKMLNEGARAAAEHTNANKRLDALTDALEKRLAQIQDQIVMMRHAMGNILKTLSTYSTVKQQLDEVEYRTLGMLRALAKSNETFMDEVEAEAGLVRSETFQELSDQDDKNRGLVNDDEGVVTEESVIILTSSCEQDPSRAIFRSKIDAGGPEIADAKDVYLGKKVGEPFEVTIQGLKHNVTILGLRKKSHASTQS